MKYTFRLTFCSLKEEGTLFSVVLAKGVMKILFLTPLYICFAWEHFCELPRPHLYG